MEGGEGGADCSSSLMLRTLRQFGLQLGFRVCLLALESDASLSVSTQISTRLFQGTAIHNL